MRVHTPEALNFSMRKTNVTNNSFLIAKSSIAAMQDPVTHSETPKDGRKSTPTIAESKTSFPPSRPVLKNSGTKYFQGKSGRTLTHPLTSTSTVMPTHENASPNIQHGYHQNGRNCKY